ncbi:MAG: hypothetical protein ACKODU_12340, partial [Limnohabitans sp.]
VKMVRDTLRAAFFKTQQKYAHPTFKTLRVLEKARFAVWRGALKIRVSVVRFRPRPPYFHRQCESADGVLLLAAPFVRRTMNLLRDTSCVACYMIQLLHSR